MRRRVLTRQMRLCRRPPRRRRPRRSTRAPRSRLPRCGPRWLPPSAARPALTGLPRRARSALNVSIPSGALCAIIGPIGAAKARMPDRRRALVRADDAPRLGAVFAALRHPGRDARAEGSACTAFWRVTSFRADGSGTGVRRVSGSLALANQKPWWEWWLIQRAGARAGGLSGRCAVVTWLLQDLRGVGPRERPLRQRVPRRPLQPRARSVPAGACGRLELVLPARPPTWRWGDCAGGGHRQASRGR